MQLYVVIILILCTALYNGPGFTLSYVVLLAHKYICTLLKKKPVRKSLHPLLQVQNFPQYK